MNFFSFVPVAGIISAVITLLLIVYLLRLLRDEKKGVNSYLTAVLGIIIFGLLSTVFLLLFTSFQNYRHLTYKKPVFKIKCTVSNPEWFSLELKPVKGDKDESQFYIINGQQFIIEGHIVKWDDFMLALGMKPLYQITRLSGRYISVEDEKSKKRSVYEINKESKIWRFLLKYGSKIPGIEASYGTAAFSYPEEKDTMNLIITNHGFIIK